MCIEKKEFLANIKFLWLNTIDMEPGESINPAENKELELKAAELAEATRKKGMGTITGKFPRNLLRNRGGWTSYTNIGNFIQGDAETTEHHLNLTQIINHTGQSEINRSNQIWRVHNYNPHKSNGEIRSYNGKHGEKDWTQYDYFMVSARGYDTPGRPNPDLIMSIAVPPEIATQIDEQVKKNVYFPDVFLKALYPDYMGDNVETHIKRAPATRIVMNDLRQKPNKTQVIKYPQPIPY